MTGENVFAYTIQLAQAHLETAAFQLNEACKSPDSRQFEYKHLRLLRTTRSNVERMERIVRKLLDLANEIENPTPVLPGLDQALLTARQDWPKSPSPHNAELPSSE